MLRKTLYLLNILIIPLNLIAQEDNFFITLNSNNGKFNLDKSIILNSENSIDEYRISITQRTKTKQFAANTVLFETTHVFNKSLRIPLDKNKFNRGIKYLITYSVPSKPEYDESVLYFEIKKSILRKWWVLPAGIVSYLIIKKILLKGDKDSNKPLPEPPPPG